MTIDEKRARRDIVAAQLRDTMASMAQLAADLMTDGDGNRAQDLIEAASSLVNAKHHFDRGFSAGGVVAWP